MGKQETFKRAMERAGISVRLYKGRWFYKGYAVETSRDEGIELQDIIRATKVPLQWDNLAFDYIVYPKESMSEEEFNKIYANWHGQK